MYDLCAVGDLLIDMFHGEEEDSFIANCGGTAMNMVICAARLGLSTSVIGRIGADIMGERIRQSLIRNGVDIKGLIEDKDYFTTMTFVVLDEAGERRFSFARQFGADVMLTPDLINEELVDNARVLYFTGMLLSQEPSRSTTLDFIKKQYEKGQNICFDVSYRKFLWVSPSEAVNVIKQVLPYVTLLKSSEEELFLLTGEKNLKKAAEKIEQYGVSASIITCGESGAAYYMNGVYEMVPGFHVHVVDTTGAGDAFFGGFLYQLCLLSDPASLSVAQLPSMVRFANATGALNVRYKGGFKGAPYLAEVITFMEESEKGDERVVL